MGAHRSPGCPQTLWGSGQEGEILVKDAGLRGVQPPGGEGCLQPSWALQPWCFCYKHAERFFQAPSLNVRKQHKGAQSSAEVSSVRKHL